VSRGEGAEKIRRTGFDFGVDAAGAGELAESGGLRAEGSVGHDGEVVSDGKWGKNGERGGVFKQKR
jgi:hypothetical protein